MLAAYLQQKLLGHKGRTFDARFSLDHHTLLTACEDGAAALWNLSTRSIQSVLWHNKETEVLRAAFLGPSNMHIVTCGADGTAIIWDSQSDHTGDHPSSSNGRKSVKYSKRCMMSHGQAQIYACEVPKGGSMLITAADSELFQWDITAGNVESPIRKWDVSAALSNSASDIDSNSDRISYGGPRNPDHQVFIFDAKISPSNQSVVSVALSDGTVRQIDLRCRSLFDGGCRSSTASCSTSVTAFDAGTQQQSSSSATLVERTNKGHESSDQGSDANADANAHAQSTVSFVDNLLRESHVRSPPRSPASNAPPVHVTSVSISSLCICFDYTLYIHPSAEGYRTRLSSLSFPAI
jgi:WD40 repeat protein